MAKAAAPYVHPRLAVIEQSVEHKAVSEMTDAELNAEIARVGALLGFADSQEMPPADPLRLQSHAKQLTHAPQPPCVERGQDAGAGASSAR